MPWIQYNTVDGSNTGWNSSQVSDDDLAKLGKAQIFYDGDPSGMMVDTTQNPPAFIQAPPPPIPPADMLTLVFNALVQQGWIDPATVDQTIIATANARLAVTGATTISTVAKAGVITVG